MRLLLGMLAAAISVAQPLNLVISQVFVNSGFTSNYHSASYVVLFNAGAAPSTTIAVNRGSFGYSNSGVAIYDNGVKRSDTTGHLPVPITGPLYYTDSAQFSPQGDVLFAINNEVSGSAFSRWSVSPNGLEFEAVQSGLDGTSNNTLNLVCFAAQSTLCLGSDGYLVDSYALTLLRNFGGGTNVVVDVKNDRVYFLQGGTQGNPVNAFALSTGHQVGTIALNLDLYPTQMQLLPNGDLIILTPASIWIVPVSLIH